MSTFSDYFGGLSAEEQEKLHQIARDSILELPRCPMDYAVLQEVLAWQRVEIDVMEAHGEWLSRTKARFERLGIPWTETEFQRRSHLWEHK
jgi:hypothetical protein